jgi:Glucose/sorbosone dehydrogenases
MSTNERDEIGEDLPPDYISSVRPGGFYGWPWYYIGNHQDPRHKGKHPELADKVIVPDVLVEAHSASLNLCFYTGDQFPSEYKGDIFAAFHGSWNRMKRLVTKSCGTVRQIDRQSGRRIRRLRDRLRTPDGKVWGRPVGSLSRKTAACLSAKTATRPFGG